MWPDGISITASRLTLTSIDDINLLNLAIAVVLLKIMPETSGRSLEQIEQDMEARYS